MPPYVDAAWMPVPTWMPLSLRGCRPWLDVVWKAFGPDRLIYGSNWPVCEWAADYATVVGIVRPWISSHGPAAEASFFQGAARKAYGLGVA